MNNHNDVMLDLETMGNGISPAIIQISAVRFDLATGETSDEFDVIVDMQSSIDWGLDVDASTVQWWMKQDDNARKAVIADGASITDALAAFCRWLGGFANSNTSVWGNGIMADNVWINAAYEKAAIESPIIYWQHKDLRTLVDMGMRKNGINFKNKEKFTGVKHNAIDDCKHQIKYASKIYNNL